MLDTRYQTATVGVLFVLRIDDDDIFRATTRNVGFGLLTRTKLSSRYYFAGV